MEESEGLRELPQHEPRVLAASPEVRVADLYRQVEQLDLSPLDVFGCSLLARAERSALLLEHVFVGGELAFDAVLFELCGLLLGQLDPLLEELRESRLRRRGPGSL